MIGAAACAVASGMVVHRVRSETAALVGVVVFGLMVAPLPTLALAALGAAIVRFRRGAARDQRARRVEEAITEAHELVLLGLAGGLSIAASAQIAREHGPREARSDLGRLLDDADRRGMLAALSDDEGAGADASMAMASALAAGAPVMPALRAHLDVVHHRHHSRRLERLRRLPIRLLVPLTLLVLPGFVVMSVGPAVVDSLARLNLF